MKIKAKYSSKSDIPKGFEDLYTQKGEEWVLTEVEGLKTEDDTNKLSEALKKEREDHKLSKDKLKKFEGIDPDKIKADLDELKELRVKAETTSDDKIEELVSKRVEASIARKLGPVERERDELKTKFAEKEKEVLTLTNKIKTTTLENAIREHAAKLNMKPQAYEDAILYGQLHLEVDDENKVFAKKDGASVEAFFNDLKNIKSHWWPDSQGGGAGGGAGGGGDSNNPWSHSHWNMTEQGKYILKHGEEKASIMAQRAGTTLGGPRPTEK